MSLTWIFIHTGNPSCLPHNGKKKTLRHKEGGVVLVSSLTGGGLRGNGSGNEGILLEHREIVFTPKHLLNLSIVYS